ncbi:restriction endonuclease subunit S [Vibrio cholerae]|nr:restriction endonuclease subunit S [Vibrio cholerae]MBY7962864.1 restriction endonuclease subunit S [Vibrio fluvialis]HCE2309253.1 restriction endonuclease subunit S [Vibrio parahaemolyticus]HCE4676764.1 restriction endonuclease subunit S [Vibrio parahaemolyticus]HCE4679829.1 restriction endonuclease subunit S [Vibrio parahaemolyticus]
MKTMKIPSGWKLCKQSDVSAFYNGRAYKLSEWETEGTPVIRLQNLTGTGNEYYYSNLKLPEHQYADNGDLLYMWSATFGPKIWQGEKAIYHYHIWKVVCKDDVLDQSFMYYNLDFITESMKSKTNGSTMLHFTKKGMEEHEILLPPLAEQEKIAEYLSTVDKKIDLIDQKIAETVKLKTGLMQKLFSEGVGVQDSDGNWQPHSEFQDSPFGKVPSSWALETLEQRLDVIKDGTHFSPKSKEGPCKYLTSKNIRFGELDLTNISYISQEEHDRIYKGSPVKYGDILLTKDGANTGNAAINTLEEPFSLLSSVAYLRGSEEDVDHGYLLQLLLSPKGQSMMKSAMAGQAITRLTLKKIGAFVLPFAPIDEQNEIERILSTVDKKLQLLKKQKFETQQLKKGLMQKLLTGEWRVPVEETEAA